VVNAREDLATEARRKPRETMPSTSIGGAKTDRRARAQQFLKDELARGPKRVTDIEEAAAKAHLDVHVLEQARADLGIVTSPPILAACMPCSGACRARGATAAPPGRPDRAAPPPGFGRRQGLTPNARSARDEG